MPLPSRSNFFILKTQSRVLDTFKNSVSCKANSSCKPLSAKPISSISEELSSIACKKRKAPLSVMLFLFSLIVFIFTFLSSANKLHISSRPLLVISLIETSKYYRFLLKSNFSKINSHAESGIEQFFNDIDFSLPDLLKKFAKLQYALALNLLPSKIICLSYV